MERNIMGELNMYRQAGMTPNFSDIARRYGMDRHTVAKYWRRGEDVEDLRRCKASAFDQVREVIEQKAAMPGATKKAVHEYLLHRRPDLALPKYNAFSAYCDSRGIAFGSRADPEPHPRFETPPGRQLQFDWKEDLTMVDANGEVFEFNVFSATLSASRMHRFIYSRTRTEEDTLLCLTATFTRFGGVTDECLTDNMSSLVTISRGKRRVHAKTLRYAREAGFDLQFCRSRTPQTKGKDESANRFLNRLSVYEGDFIGEEGLIEAIANIEARSNEEPCETTGLPPAVLFMREKEFLRPIGNLALLEEMVGKVTRCTVPDTMLVRACGREWSVPRRCIGRKAKVTSMPSGQVVIEVEGEVVAVHDALAEPMRKFNYDPGHYMQAISGKRRFADCDIEQAARANLELLDGMGGRW